MKNPNDGSSHSFSEDTSPLCAQRTQQGHFLVCNMLVSSETSKKVLSFLMGFVSMHRILASKGLEIPCDDGLDHAVLLILLISNKSLERYRHLVMNLFDAKSRDGSRFRTAFLAWRS